jgi:hypothetical protein
VFLKPKRLLLRTLQTTTSVDPTFPKDIRISLLSNPFALKFKQSCTDSRSQDGQIEGLDSQIPDSKILDPESSDFLNSCSQSIDHMKAKGLAMILVQDSNLWMGSYIIKDYFIFQMVYVDFEFSNSIMIFLLQDILASIKLWSLYRVISSSHRYGKLLRIMLQ